MLCKMSCNFSDRGVAILSYFEVWARSLGLPLWTIYALSSTSISWWLELAKTMNKKLVKLSNSSLKLILGKTRTKKCLRWINSRVSQSVKNLNHLHCRSSLTSHRCSCSRRRTMMKKTRTTTMAMNMVKKWKKRRQILRNWWPSSCLFIWSCTKRPS